MLVNSCLDNFVPCCAALQHTTAIIKFQFAWLPHEKGDVIRCHRPSFVPPVHSLRPLLEPWHIWRIADGTIHGQDFIEGPLRYKRV